MTAFVDAHDARTLASVHCNPAPDGAEPRDWTRGRLRGLPFETEQELWDAVHETCLAKFKAFFGWGWVAPPPTEITKEETTSFSDSEKRARAVFEELRRVFAIAHRVRPVRVRAYPPGEGEAAHWLREWLRAVERLPASQKLLRDRPWTLVAPLPDTRREIAWVVVLKQRDGRDIKPKHAAWQSLLEGSKPQLWKALPWYTVGRVIEAETKTMRLKIERERKRWRRAESAQRENKRRKPQRQDGPIWPEHTAPAWDANTLRRFEPPAAPSHRSRA